MSNGDEKPDQVGDELRELRERAGRLLDELADSGGASRAVAFRMRALLSEPLSASRLESVVAALESTADEVRTLEQLTASIKALGPRSTSAEFAAVKGTANRVQDRAFAGRILDQLDGIEIARKMLATHRAYKSTRRGNGDSSAASDSLRDLIERLRRLRGG